MIKIEGENPCKSGEYYLPGYVKSNGSYVHGHCVKRGKKNMAKKEEKYLPGKARDTHFKNKEAWRKYTAYIHMHNIPHHKVQTVWIAGKKHKVNCEGCK